MAAMRGAGDNRSEEEEEDEDEMEEAAEVDEEQAGDEEEEAGEAGGGARDTRHGREEEEVDDIECLRRTRHLERALRSQHPNGIVVLAMPLSLLSPLSRSRVSHHRLCLKYAVIIVWKSPSRLSVYETPSSSSGRGDKGVQTSAMQAVAQVGNASHDAADLMVLPRRWQEFRFESESSMTVMEHDRLMWCLSHGGLSYTVLNHAANPADAIRHHVETHYDRTDDDALYACSRTSSTWSNASPPYGLPPRQTGLQGKPRGSSSNNKDGSPWPRVPRDTLAMLGKMRERALQILSATCVEALDDLEAQLARGLQVIDARLDRIERALPAE